MSVSYLKREGKNRLAYVHSEAKAGVKLPYVLFLGGFKSDMQGTKAQYLEAQCKARGQGFVRFDYSGHGQSDGQFVEGTIGIWRDDARDILDEVAQGPVILVGSSMGGWIALLLMSERAARVQGVVGIAAAPDFTKDVEARMGTQERDELKRTGRLEVSSEYDDEPYIFTQGLLEDGKGQRVLGRIHMISKPLILVQGKLDADVPWQKTRDIRDAYPACSIDVIFVEDGDHRLSRPQDLALIDAQIVKLSTL